MVVSDRSGATHSLGVQTIRFWHAQELTRQQVGELLCCLLATYATETADKGEAEHFIDAVSKAAHETVASLFLEMQEGGDA